MSNMEATHIAAVITDCETKTWMGTPSMIPRLRRDIGLQSLKTLNPKEHGYAIRQKTGHQRTFLQNILALVCIRTMLNRQHQCYAYDNHPGKNLKLGAMRTQ